MEALLASGSKHDRDVVVVPALRRQETEKLHTSSISFVTAFNNETNGILNLSGDHETGAHGNTCHVSNLLNNGGVHRFIVTVNGEMLALIVMGGKTADISASRGTDNANVKGLFMSCSIAQDSGTLSCTQVALTEIGSVGEPGFFLRSLVMCSRKGKGKVVGLATCWFRVFSNAWLRTCNELHSKDLSIGKAVTVFGFCKSMTRRARRGERELSCRSLHRRHVPSEPGHFTSPKSWMPWDLRSPLKWAPSLLFHSACFSARNFNNAMPNLAAIWDLS